MKYNTIIFTLFLFISFISAQTQLGSDINDDISI